MSRYNHKKISKFLICKKKKEIFRQTKVTRKKKDMYRLKQSLIVSSVAVSGRLAIANHLDSVDLVDNDTLLVEVSLGMTKIHSIDNNESMYKLKSVNHIQTHTINLSNKKQKIFRKFFKVRTMAIVFAVDVG